MKKHKRALSLLLIICIMCCAFFGSVESANALVLNPWTIALCGTILCAMGLTFTDTSAMEAAANSFASSLDAETLTFIIDSATTLASGVSNGIFTVTQSIVDALMNWLVSVSPEGGYVNVTPYLPYDTSVFGLDIVPYAGSFNSAKDAFDSISSSIEPLSNDVLLNLAGKTVPLPVNSNNCYGNPDSFTSNDKSSWRWYVTSNSSEVWIYLWPSDKSDGSQYKEQVHLSSNNPYYKYFTYTYLPSGSLYLVTTVGTSRYSFEIASVNSPSYSGSLSIPFSDVWAPGSSDEEKALVPGASVKLPKGLVQDGALDSDVVGTMTPESVRAGTSDIPDVIAGTGTITGTGEGTGIFEGIGSLVLDIPIIGTIASTLSEILEAIKGFFDVSRFDLNFDSLKIGLTKVFPFCIPFDFFNAIKMFSSDASAFVFDINLETEYFTIDHTVDLTPFRLPILFFRYVVVFWFGFILISRTKDFMKW